ARTLDVGAPDDDRFVTGFFPAEQDNGATFRWSGDRAQLVLYGAETGLLDLRLYGNIYAPPGAQHLRLERAGQAFAEIVLRPGWRRYQVALRPPQAPAVPGIVALDLICSTYRSPAPDNRDLGISVDWARVVPSAGAVPPINAPLQRALLLTWVVGLLFL